MTLFAPAFPIAAVVCYFSFMAEIRTDAYKLLRNTQRPRYSGAQDIGSWHKVLAVMGIVSIFTNMGLIGFTSTVFSGALPISVFGIFEINADNQVFFLFVCEHLMLGIHYVISALLPDVTTEVAIARANILWRKRATLEVFHSASQGLDGRPRVLEGESVLSRPPRLEWDDAAIPAWFSRDAAEEEPDQEWRQIGARLEPDREWLAAGSAAAEGAGIALLSNRCYPPLCSVAKRNGAATPPVGRLLASRDVPLAPSHASPSNTCHRTTPGAKAWCKLQAPPQMQGSEHEGAATTGVHEGTDVLLVQRLVRYNAKLHAPPQVQGSEHELTA